MRPAVSLVGFGSGLLLGLCCIYSGSCRISVTPTWGRVPLTPHASGAHPMEESAGKCVRSSNLLRPLTAGQDRCQETNVKTKLAVRSPKQWLMLLAAFPP